MFSTAIGKSAIRNLESISISIFICVNCPSCISTYCIYNRIIYKISIIGIIKIKSVSSFTEILSLVGYKISKVYAGCSHSLFQTRKLKILSCGSNRYGELLLSSGPGNSVYSPTETTINGGAELCIAGDCISVIFLGSSPSPNTPNIRIHEYV